MKSRRHVKSRRDVTLRHAVTSRRNMTFGHELYDADLRGHVAVGCVNAQTFSSSTNSDLVTNSDFGK